MKTFIGIIFSFYWLIAGFAAFVLIHGYITKDWHVFFLGLGIILIPVFVYGVVKFIKNIR